MKLEDKIVEYAKNKNNSWHKPQIGIYHASRIYDICTGKLKPKDFFKERDLTDRTLVIFEIGNMYHNYVQQVIYPNEIQEYPVQIEDDGWKIVGRVDLIVNGNIIDLKTVSNLPTEPKIDHIYQLNVYLEAMNKPYGYITYIEKNPIAFNTVDFKVKRDKKLIKEIKEKVGLFHKELCQI